MAKSTGIIWAKSTFNAWTGCTKVGPGCDHCYAEAMMDKRLHVVQWGAGQPRKRTSPANWKQPLAWVFFRERNVQTWELGDIRSRFSAQPELKRPSDGAWLINIQAVTGLNAIQMAELHAQVLALSKKSAITTNIFLEAIYLLTAAGIGVNNAPAQPAMPEERQKTKPPSRYVVISAYDLSILTNLVNSAMKDGYSPQGGITEATPLAGDRRAYLQAMFRP